MVVTSRQVDAKICFKRSVLSLLRQTQCCTYPLSYLCRTSGHSADVDGSRDTAGALSCQGRQSETWCTGHLDALMQCLEGIIGDYTVRIVFFRCPTFWGVRVGFGSGVYVWVFLGGRCFFTNSTHQPLSLDRRNALHALLLFHDPRVWPEHCVSLVPEVSACATEGHGPLYSTLFIWLCLFHRGCQAPSSLGPVISYWQPTDGEVLHPSMTPS